MFPSLQVKRLKRFYEGTFFDHDGEFLPLSSYTMIVGPKHKPTPADEEAVDKAIKDAERNMQRKIDTQLFNSSEDDDTLKPPSVMETATVESSTVVDKTPKIKNKLAGRST